MILKFYLIVTILVISSLNSFSEEDISFVGFTFGMSSSEAQAVVQNSTNALARSWERQESTGEQPENISVYSFRGNTNLRGVQSTSLSFIDDALYEVNIKYGRLGDPHTRTKDLLSLLEARYGAFGSPHVTTYTPQQNPDKFPLSFDLTTARTRNTTFKYSKQVESLDILVLSKTEYRIRIDGTGRSYGDIMSTGQIKITAVHTDLRNKVNSAMASWKEKQEIQRQNAIEQQYGTF